MQKYVPWLKMTTSRVQEARNTRGRRAKYLRAYSTSGCVVAGAQNRVSSRHAAPFFPKARASRAAGAPNRDREVDGNKDIMRRRPE